MLIEYSPCCHLQGQWCWHEGECRCACCAIPCRAIPCCAIPCCVSGQRGPICSRLHPLAWGVLMPSRAHRAPSVWPHCPAGPAGAPELPRGQRISAWDVLVPHVLTCPARGSCWCCSFLLCSGSSIKSSSKALVLIGLIHSLITMSI